MKLEATGNIYISPAVLEVNGIDLLETITKRFVCIEDYGATLIGRISIEITPIDKTCTIDGQAVDAEA
nr:MAG TPA: hypothetical protein [Caudoviricetes sp.]